MIEKGRITAIGPDIFRMDVQPLDLFTTAGAAPDDQREAWEGLAHDLAVIRDLPTIAYANLNR